MSQERTLPASPRRREEARRQGFLPRSPALTAAVVLLAGVAALGLFGPRALEAQLDLLRRGLSLDPGLDARAAALPVGLALLPFAALLVAAAVLASALQTGIVARRFSLGALWRPIEPLRGLGRAGHAAAQLAAVAIVLAVTLWTERRELAPQHWASVSAAFAVRAAAALLALGILDCLWRRWRLERALLMTVQEARDERRRSEGDPKIRARRRTLAREVRS
jgi:flagellar biosynthetic protein FlhB